MNNPKNPKLGHNKKTFLEKPIEHIDITSFDSRKIIESMSKMSFTSRDTANASSIFNEMISDKNCTIFLTLAGSTSAAGCMKIYSDMIKYNMVDAVIATGASIIDMDFFEALAVSLEVKDILFIDSIIFLESKDVISICSTGVSRKVFLL